MALRENLFTFTHRDIAQEITRKIDSTARSKRPSLSCKTASCHLVSPANDLGNFGSHASFDSSLDRAASTQRRREVLRAKAPCAKQGG